MIRDVVERTIANPTNEDIKSIRKEAFEQAIVSGAQAETIEITIEIDKQKNIVRGIATGATELRTRDLLMRNLNEEDLIKVASESMDSSIEETKLVAKTGNYNVYKGINYTRKFFGLLKSTETPIRLIDNEGVVRLQKKWGEAKLSNGKNVIDDLNKFVEENTIYGDGGEELPYAYIINGHKIVDLSGLTKKEQIVSIAEMELADINPDDEVVILVTR